MDDRDLLELAARAFGIGPVLAIGPEGAVIGPSGRIRIWSPLTDDADCFRLAVRLKMTLDVNLWHENVQVRAYDKSSGSMHHIDEFGDQLQASRRAIVRAAAEIGKAMP